MMEEPNARARFEIETAQERLFVLRMLKTHLHKVVGEWMKDAHRDGLDDLTTFGTAIGEALGELVWDEVEQLKELIEVDEDFYEEIAEAK